MINPLDRLAPISTEFNIPADQHLLDAAALAQDVDDQTQDAAPQPDPNVEAYGRIWNTGSEPIYRAPDSHNGYKRTTAMGCANGQCGQFASVGIAYHVGDGIVRCGLCIDAEGWPHRRDSRLKFVD